MLIWFRDAGTTYLRINTANPSVAKIRQRTAPWGVQISFFGSRCLCETTSNNPSSPLFSAFLLLLPNSHKCIHMYTCASVQTSRVYGKCFSLYVDKGSAFQQLQGDFVLSFVRDRYNFPITRFKTTPGQTS